MHIDFPRIQRSEIRVKSLREKPHDDAMSAAARFFRKTTDILSILRALYFIIRNSTSPFPHTPHRTIRKVKMISRIRAGKDISNHSETLRFRKYSLTLGVEKLPAMSFISWGVFSEGRFEACWTKTSQVSVKINSIVWYFDITNLVSLHWRAARLPY